MDPTSLPTDNLYKFVTLACLLGFALLCYTMSKKHDHVSEKKLGLELEHAKHKARVDRVNAAAQLGALNDEWSKVQHENDLKKLDLDVFDFVIGTHGAKLQGQCERAAQSADSR